MKVKTQVNGDGEPCQYSNKQIELSDQIVVGPVSMHEPKDIVNEKEETQWSKAQGSWNDCPVIQQYIVLWHADVVIRNFTPLSKPEDKQRKWDNKVARTTETMKRKFQILRLKMKRFWEFNHPLFVEFERSHCLWSLGDKSSATLWYTYT